jgi:hypothetical protein
MWELLNGGIHEFQISLVKSIEVILIIQVQECLENKAVVNLSLPKTLSRRDNGGGEGDGWVKGVYTTYTFSRAREKNIQFFQLLFPSHSSF